MTTDALISFPTEVTTDGDTRVTVAGDIRVVDEP